MVKPILEEASGMKAGQDFHLAFAYERVMVGRLLFNITHLPRIVGGINTTSTERAVQLYNNIVKAQIHSTDAMTAEVAKTVENTYRDVNIAFANEVALISESLGIDAYRVRELVNTLPNVPGDSAKNPIRNMHLPGAGVGGHCLPKDSWLLKYGLDTYGRTEVNPKVIVSSRHLNDWMPIHMVDMLEEELEKLGKKMEGAKVAILGLAFLPDSDDTRNSPSYTMQMELRKRGANPVVHDSLVKEDDDVPTLTDDLWSALAGSCGVLLSTAHEEYGKIELGRLKETLVARSVIIDGRAVWKPEQMKEVGLNYRSIGKGLKYN